VCLERGDGSLALTITDNGSTKAGDIPSAAGEHDGLGLLVIDSLAKQENAEYEYTASNGSSFRFVAPFDEREEGAEAVASSPR
jgi:two-component sensor histidine kinase